MTIKYLPPRTIARTAAMLQATLTLAPYTPTPMADAYARHTKAGARDTDFERSKFVKIARLLGWRVCKRGGNYYENGILIWQNEESV